MFSYFTNFFSSPFESNAIHSPVLWYIYVNTGMCHMSYVELKAFFSFVLFLFLYLYVVLATKFLSDSSYVSQTYKTKAIGFYFRFLLLFLGARCRKSYKYFFTCFYLFLYVSYLSYIGFIPYRVTLDVHLIFLFSSTLLFLFLIGTIKIKNFFYFDLTGEYIFVFYSQVFKNLKVTTKWYFFLSLIYVLLHFIPVIHYSFVVKYYFLAVSPSNIVMIMRYLDIIYCFFESYLYTLFVCYYIHLLVGLDFKNRSVLIQYPIKSYSFLKKTILDFCSKHYQTLIRLFWRR